MITNAWNEKAEAEEKMQLQWLSEHGHVRNDSFFCLEQIGLWTQVYFVN